MEYHLVCFRVRGCLGCSGWRDGILGVGMWGWQGGMGGRVGRDWKGAMGGRGERMLARVSLRCGGCLCIGILCCWSFMYGFLLLLYTDTFENIMY